MDRSTGFKYVPLKVQTQSNSMNTSSINLYILVQESRHNRTPLQYKQNIKATEMGNTNVQNAKTCNVCLARELVSRRKCMLCCNDNTNRVRRLY